MENLISIYFSLLSQQTSTKKTESVAANIVL